MIDEKEYNQKEYEKIIEAVLFAMGQSVELSRLAAAIEQTEENTKRIVDDLITRYIDEDRGMQIIELDGMYQMCTKPEMYDALIRVTKKPKKQVLSDSILETLSIIAYRQPITKTEIENIRGVSGEYAVNKLLEYGLIYEVGRLDVPGRPLLFATTEEFLRRFGIESKEALPNLDITRETKLIKEVEEELKYNFGFERIGE